MLIGTITIGQSQEIWEDELKTLATSESQSVFLKTNTSQELTSGYDVKYYQIHLDIDPSSTFIQGKVAIYFIPHSPLENLIFDLNQSLVVDSIQNIDTSSFMQLENQIIIQKSYPENILDSVIVFYSGTATSNQNAIVSSTHNSTPILWTLSEPYGSSDWWPCKQSLTDKADSLDVFITTNSIYRAASNGLLINQSTNGSKTTYHWKHRYPIVDYLVAIAVTNYIDISFDVDLSTGTLPVQNYIYPEDSLEFANPLLLTDTLLHLFDSIIGPYPFANEKYGHAQFSRGGGMEHQTMSFMTNFSFSLNAHELAHQWFGDKITCATWTDLWLNESFATYFTGIAYENLRSDSLWQEWKSSVLSAVVSEPDGSVYITDTTSISRMFDPRLTYRKGAYVLHMLRKQMGDGAFFQGVQQYISDPNLAYSTAYTKDFFGHMQQFTPLNLNQFSEEWIYGEGYPNFLAEWTQKNQAITITLSQTTSHPSVSFYHLQVPILIKGTNGELSWVNMNHQVNFQEETFQVGFEIEDIVIDPNLSLLAKSKTSINPTSFETFKLYPNPADKELIINPGGDYRIINSYRVYAIDGKLIYTYSGSPINTLWSIDVSNWVPGQYLIEIDSGNRTTIHKFIVDHFN